jgi:hypothetical protein
MTLYRCKYSPLLLPFGLGVWTVKRNDHDGWSFEADISAMMIKIENSSIVLWIEKSNRPLYTNNLVKTTNTSVDQPYHICLYEDIIIAIPDSKWKKYFTKIKKK